MGTHSGDGLIFSESHNYDGNNEPLSPDNWLVSPELTLGGTLTFYAKAEDNPGDLFAVYVCIGTPTGVDDFVKVAGDFATTWEYVKYEIDLSAYQGQVGHFAIVHHNCSDYFVLNIDDITFDVNGVALPNPLTPVVTVDPAATSAYVAWGADEGAANFDLRYRPFVVNFPMDTDSGIGGLQQSLQDWGMYDADGDGHNWEVSHTNDSNTGYCLMSVSQDLTPDNWLFSPETKLEGILRFTYWCDNYNFSNEHLMVYAVIGKDTIPLAGEDYVAKVRHQSDTIDLSQFGGQRGKIAFRHYNCEHLWALYLDDIFIGDPNIEWIDVKELTQSNYIINNLTPLCPYQVQVMGYNADHQSKWSKVVNFWTLSGVRGDVNNDGKVGIADVTTLIDMLLADAPSYSSQADCDRSWAIDIADVTTLIDYLLSGNWADAKMVYTVVGTPLSVFEEEWDPNYEGNEMVKGDDGLYRLTKMGIYLTEWTEVKFKIIQNHNMDISWPEEEWSTIIPDTGVWNFYITFDRSTGEVICNPERVDRPE